MRLGEMRRVHPMARPPLAMPRRRQELVHDPPSGVLGTVAEENPRFLRSGREAGQVETNPAQPGPLLRRRRGRHPPRFEFMENKGVDGRPRPAALTNRRHRRLNERTIGPMVGWGIRPGGPGAREGEGNTGR
jgi:hypothetical protein